MAVDAIKPSASDFTEKPVDHDELLSAIERALKNAKTMAQRSAWHAGAAKRIAGLTARQRQIMEVILAGHSSKRVATDLDSS